MKLIEVIGTALYRAVLFTFVDAIARSVITDSADKLFIDLAIPVVGMAIGMSAIGALKGR